MRHTNLRWYRFRGNPSAWCSGLEPFRGLRVPGRASLAREMPCLWLFPARSRRWRRLAGSVAAAAWLAGGCSLDDRTLTEPRQLDSGGDPPPLECGAQGDNACETCLYDACCEQARACGLGSPCARYFDCVAGCNSEQDCKDACGVQYPSGFGDAVALSVCASSRCSVCSGQGAAQTCDPTGPGACQSALDCAAIESGALQDLDLSGCPACNDDLHGSVCQSCLSQQSGLSSGCSACVLSALSCTVDYCLVPCQGGSDPSACERCMSSAGCIEQLASCGFS